MRRVGLAASVAVLLMVVSRVASGGVIYDNASSLGTLIAPYGIVTNPGGGAGGADASFLVSPDGSTGWNANSLNLNRLADDFTVPVGSRWILTGARFLAFTTGATSPTLTEANLRIWNGNPMSGGTVLFGDTSTNRQTAVGWVGSTPIYRGSSTSASTSTRRVQYSESAFSVTLDPGTYWIDFQMTSSAFSLFVPPLSVSGGGSVVTGNALHFSNDSWSAAVDILSGRAKGMPFQILGGTEQVVPEPSSVVLTALGVAGFVLLRRRRK